MFQDTVSLSEPCGSTQVIFGDSRHPEDEWRVRLAGGAGFHLVIRQAPGGFHSCGLPLTSWSSL